MTAKLLRAALVFCVARVFAAEPTYPPHPDAQPQAGVPKGETFKYEFTSSKIFPGTVHEVTVYVPKQYDPVKPACVHVNQDGVQNNAPVVFDNLIAKGEIPVLVGVFVKPGIVKAQNSEKALDRFNRSYEYDGLGDALARFILDEVLPDVEKHSTSDGRPIRLSKSGNDRCIGGQSSGAIAAFNVAWERPDAFTRVFSSIGTYVSLRGADRLPGLVRKTEPKPLRVFLQDGSNDLNIYGGDWWMANQTMERALTYANYEVNHAWGAGGHSGNQAASIYPDAMRWLWKGWPEPVKAGQLPQERIGPIVTPENKWKLVGDGYRLAEGAVVNAKGEVFFDDIPNHTIYKIGADGKPIAVVTESKNANGEAFGPDGRLYTVATATQQVIAYDENFKPTVIASEIAGNDLVVGRNGNIYVTNPPAGNSNDPSKVWLIKPDGTKQVVDSGLRYANGIAFSPDQSLLYVADYRSHWVYSFVVQADGTLANKQRYFWLHEPDSEDMSFADGIKVDRNGLLYVATRLGIQICDQAGRVNMIVPTPNGRITNLVFGSEKFDTLYATCNDKVYKRHLNTTGANAWDEPNKPAPPRL